MRNMLAQRKSKKDKKRLKHKKYKKIKQKSQEENYERESLVKQRGKSSLSDDKTPW